MASRGLLRVSFPICLLRETAKSKPTKKGDMFCSENIMSKRLGTGISPMLIDEIIGRHADRDFKVNEQIKI